MTYIFFLLSRSPALKPLWLSLGGSDVESLFSGLFRKFFCHNSKEYFAALKVSQESSGYQHQRVVPAYLLHIKDLALGLQRHLHSSIIIMEDNQLSSVQQLQSTQMPSKVAQEPPVINVSTTISTLLDIKASERNIHFSSHVLSRTLRYLGR